ncbi:hypothetical protein F5144DRAFT_570051 [Chaetomium tenue]|uniref:Uncharacterized protein n=1 Tax=Chaetomium tenue TaxID=1854479 RepID=A0ACB7PH08_9PEZI|nr:hypothetical protein F5144DRAFT_570051 [Chaetomium globosum]
MATSQELHITDPAQLQALSLPTKLSDLGLAHNTATHKKTTTQQAMPPLRLALLQPLADPATLAACYDPPARTTHHCGSWDQALDISPLAKAWRQALAKAPPASHITFDLRLPGVVLRLPKRVGGGQAPTRMVHWKPNAHGIERALGIPPHTVTQLVVTIATAARMRVPADLLFKVSYTGEQGIPAENMKMLRTLLEGFATAKGTVSTHTVDVGEANEDARSVGKARAGRCGIQCSL